MLPKVEPKLAIDGGSPVRTEPLPLEFPGVHHIGEQEIEAAVRVLRSRSLFRYYGVDLQCEADRFEADFRAFTGARHALAVSSGTGALHVALAALGAGPGQEIIVPAFLWVSVAAAVVNLGAVPVLADIDDTFCLDPADVERRITPHTRGIVMIHMSGAPGDVRSILDIARRHGLFLLEDCAQCAGGTIGGRNVGTFGDAAVFSFQMNKNITAGEGGCAITDDDRLYARMFASHDLGYMRDETGRLVTSDPDLLLWGRGYRMDEIRAAVLRVQLAKLPRIVGAMRHSKRRIRAALQGMPEVGLRRLVDSAGDTSCFLLTIFRDGATAAAACDALRAEGIVTYPQGVANILLKDFGLHAYYNIASLVRRGSVDRARFPWSHPSNQGLGGRYERGTCPVADDLFERTLMLPIPSCLTQGDEDDIIAAYDKVTTALAERRETS
ncbi:MAG TPA: DegT/DnrJ/EryC1/StrS family aminotransferase [Bryobacteraceae bacterium]|nr:DegT/DnrJ/EryC1/StrS family aminotransferase [Bryobacteraceae bacterium]